MVRLAGNKLPAFPEKLSSVEVKNTWRKDTLLKYPGTLI